MNVLHIYDSSDRGVSTHNIKNLAKGLKAKGIHSIVIEFVPNRSELSSGNNDNGVLSLKRPKTLGFIQAFKLLKLVRRYKISTIHTHGKNVYGLGGWLGRISRISTLHTAYEKYDVRLGAFVLGGYQKIVATSNLIRDHFKLIQKVNDQKLRTIYPGIDVDAGKKELLDQNEQIQLRRAIGVNDGRRVLGAIGPLVLEQDQATLLKCLAKLIRKEEKIDLVIFGDGPIRNELNELAENLGVTEHFKIVDPNKISGNPLDCMDILAISAYEPQKAEMFLEGMLRSKPIIATKIAHHREYVEQRDTGYLVPCGFPERIESAVKMLLAISNLIEQTGQNAYKNVTEKFSLNRMVEQYKELYS